MPPHTHHRRLAAPPRLKRRDQQVPDRAILIGLPGKGLQPLHIDPVDHIPSVGERGLTLGRDRAADVVVVCVGDHDHLDATGPSPALGKRSQQLAGCWVPRRCRRSQPWSASGSPARHTKSSRSDAPPYDWCPGGSELPDPVVVSELQRVELPAGSMADLSFRCPPSDRGCPRGPARLRPQRGPRLRVDRFA